MVRPAGQQAGRPAGNSGAGSTRSRDPDPRARSCPALGIPSHDARVMSQPALFIPETAAQIPRRRWLAPLPAAVVLLLVAGGSFTACSGRPTTPRADLILMNARVYTLAWSEPGADGIPAASAPHQAAGWTPDAQAVAIGSGRIL